MSNYSPRPIYRASRTNPPIRRVRFRDIRRMARNRLSAHPEDESIDPDKLSVLPDTAEALRKGTLERFGFNGTLEVLFAGGRDENSALAALREYESTVVREIYSYISNQWARHVKLTIPAALVGSAPWPLSGENVIMRFNRGRNGHENWSAREIEEGVSITSSGYDDGFVSYARVGRVEFPEPNGRNVNMLPFIFGDKDSLPGDLQCYFPLIEQCPYLLEDVGKVGYLTVHESYVDVEKAQRREGLHIESPGISPDGLNASFTPAKEHCWGMGMFYDLDRYDGGIFMASSVLNTCEVWNALVDSRVPGIVDRHGGCEHLRGLIGQGTQLEAGELVWMTDLTPHEALPQKESGFRTFFRVVTPNVSHWYAEHSTENPKVPVPSNVTIVFGNKFT